MANFTISATSAMGDATIDVTPNGDLGGRVEHRSNVNLNGLNGELTTIPLRFRLSLFGKASVQIDSVDKTNDPVEQVSRDAHTVAISINTNVERVALGETFDSSVSVNLKCGSTFLQKDGSWNAVDTSLSNEQITDLSESYNTFRVIKLPEGFGYKQNETVVITFNIVPNQNNQKTIDLVYGWDISEEAHDVISHTVSLIQESGVPILTVAPQALEFEAAGGSKDLSVTSNRQWTVTVTPESFSIDNSSGNNNGKIKVTAAENKGLTNITGTLTVYLTGESNKANISLTQRGVDIQPLEVTPNVIAFPRTGGTGEFNISTNEGWTISMD